MFLDSKTLKLFGELAPQRSEEPDNVEDYALSSGDKSKYKDINHPIQNKLQQINKEGNTIQQLARFLDAKPSKDFSASRYSGIIYVCLSLSPNLAIPNNANTEHPLYTLLSTQNIKISDSLITELLNSCSELEGYFKFSLYLKNPAAIERFQHYASTKGTIVPEDCDFITYLHSLQYISISFIFTEDKKKAHALILQEFKFLLTTELGLNALKLNNNQLRIKMSKIVQSDPHLKDAEKIVQEILDSQNVSYINNPNISYVERLERMRYLASQLEDPVEEIELDLSDNIEIETKQGSGRCFIL